MSRPRKRRKLLAPREPRAAQRAYLRALRHVWGVCQSVILRGLEPLLSVWPSDSGGGRRQETIGDNYPGQSKIRADDALSPGPLNGELPTIHQVSDDELRRLWPHLSPDEVREWAPWAVSREAVVRAMVPAGQPWSELDLENYVARAVRAARTAGHPAGEPTFGSRPSLRAPEAFGILRPERPPPAPPVILGADGLPLPPPPVPTRVTTESISETFGWTRLNLGRLVREENLSRILDSAGQAVSAHTARELRRVLAIDVRRDVPGLQPLIDQWREANVRLIESGILASEEAPGLRSLLADVSSTVEEAHAGGLRVEALAGQLQERFGVSDRRAELIARDQTLKLNAQIAQHRQQQAGITQYRWKAVGDDRTRPRHQELDGQTFDWASPPEVAPGRHEHPGGDYQCRCVAVPVLPDWIA